VPHLFAREYIYYCFISIVLLDSSSSSSLTGRKKCRSERLLRRRSTFLEHEINGGGFSHWGTGNWCGSHGEGGTFIDNPNFLRFRNDALGLMGFRGGLFGSGDVATDNEACCLLLVALYCAFCTLDDGVHDESALAHVGGADESS